MAGPALVGLVAAASAAVFGTTVDRRRKREFRARYPTFEEFRAAVDEPAVRAVLTESGPVAAVRKVRTDHPGAPLVEAKRYVDTLTP
ncbi:hypothetical protein ACN20G_10135 [Streptomyces sp. BI20]|uniref:hypothetical protein n=1 Tax=Streptomyces sp. BI20 TaxID=3403460 RepID=UPI003C7345B0